MQTPKVVLEQNIKELEDDINYHQGKVESYIHSITDHENMIANSRALMDQYRAALKAIQ